jgi:hypothetical protein
MSRVNKALSGHEQAKYLFLKPLGLGILTVLLLLLLFLLLIYISISQPKFPPSRQLHQHFLRVFFVQMSFRQLFLRTYVEKKLPK